MGGRIYDALLGRFLSADPFVQAPGNLQNYNRYSYVLNNPLSYTDPSGFFFKKLFGAVGDFVKKYWKPILAVVATVLTAGWMAWTLAGGATNMGYWAAMGKIATGGFSAVGTFTAGQMMAIGFAGGFAGGLVGTGSLKGALIGGIGGAMAAGIGFQFENGLADSFGRFNELARASAHGINGGVMSELSGGSFSGGFLGGSFGSLASHYGPQAESFSGNLVKAAVVGGTASTLGGGRFENGAVSGAFQHLFNKGLAEAQGKNGVEYVIAVNLEKNPEEWVNRAQASEAHVRALKRLIAENPQWGEGVVVDFNDYDSLISSLRPYKNAKDFFILTHGSTDPGPQYLWVGGTSYAQQTLDNLIAHRLGVSTFRSVHLGCSHLSSPNELTLGHHIAVQIMLRRSSTLRPKIDTSLGDF